MRSDFLRRYGVLFGTGIAGVILFLLFLDRVAPSASLDLRRSRADIMEAGAAYLTRLGFDHAGLHQDAWLNFDPLMHMVLQRSSGIEGANRSYRADTAATHEWALAWYDAGVSNSQSVLSYRAWLSPSGRPLGFEQRVPDTLALPSLDHETARRLALAFLREQQIDLSGFLLQTDSDVKLTGRTDHRFVWQRSGPSAESTVSVRVQGDRVGAFRHAYGPGGDLRREVSEAQTALTFVYAASMAGLFFLFFFVVILFLRKYHEGEVGVQTAVLVFAGIYAAQVLATVNGYPSIGTSTIIGDMNLANTRLVVFGMQAFIVHVFFGVMAFAAWSVGESSARTIAPWKLTGADSALFRSFFTKDLGSGIVLGYAWGATLLGVQTLLFLALSGREGFAVMATGIGDVPESYLPALQPVLRGFGRAITTEIIFRVFFLNYLQERTRRAWPGIVAGTLVWTIASVIMWEEPLGSIGPLAGLLAVAAYGLFFAFLYLRYDAVTTVVANFVLTAMGMSIPMLATAEGYGHVMGIIFLILMLIPLAIGIAGVIGGRPFSFTGVSLPAHIRRISERERMAKELEIARTVQVSLLPKSHPVIAGFDIAGICIPAKEVGGDYYDFVTLPEGRLGIALGDVSGKGVPAAIYMTLTKGILQSHAEEGVSPRSVLSKVNTLMYRTIERNSFVSMFYAILDAPSRKIRIARAGQCPVILTQQAGEKGAFVTPRGMALGLERGTVFDAVLEEQELSLAGGQVLVFYTDGFTEAMDMKGDEFGEERLLASIERHRALPASRLIDAITADVNAFAGDAPQHDDMTMIVVRVL